MIRFTKAKNSHKRPKPPGGKNFVLDRLKAFLAAAEPQAIEFLVSFWNSQAEGITYAELREAFVAGDLTAERYRQWTQDYSALILEKLAPVWRQAAAEGAKEIQTRYPHFLYDPSASASMNFIRQHGAELVTNITLEQHKALNAVVAHISGYTAVTPDEAARIIRPTVGLTVGQTLANARYREAVKQAYMKEHPKGRPETAEKRAAEAAARYSARQHRYRAQNIARTELAFAYNAGHHGAAKDAQAQGYIGNCIKVWLTAFDERVCPVCSAMDGEKRNMDEAFSTGELLPPAHPSCRCAVAYEEIENSSLDPMDAQARQDAEQTAQLPTLNQPDLTPEKPIGEPIDAKTAETNPPDSETSSENQFKTQGYIGLSGAESDVFMETYHNKSLLRNNKRVNDLSGEESGHIINSAFNERVRTGNETEADKLLMEQIDRAISENALPQDMTLFRGCSYKALPQIDINGKTLEEIVEAINGKRGVAWSPGNYIQVSASSERNFFTDADVSLQIVADKGTPAYISSYKAESEIILGRDTKFEIIGADIVDGTKDIYGMDAGKRVTAMVRVVPSTSQVTTKSYSDMASAWKGGSNGRTDIQADHQSTVKRASP